MIRALILSTSAMLSACTSFEPLRPDMHARPVPSRVDEIAYINGLRTAYEMPVDAGNCYVGSGLKAFRPKFVQGYREYDENAERLAAGACVQFKSLQDELETDRRAVRDYLANGFGLTDLYCQRFFMVAAETRQSRRMQSSTLAGVDTLVTSVFTALGAGTITNGIVNNAFEAATATYNNIDSSFLVAPDRDDLIKLVQAAQDSIRKEAFSDLPKTYPGARSVIERYSSMCSFDGMRSLVGVAMKEAATALNDDTAKKKTGSNGDAQTAAIGADGKTQPVASVDATTKEQKSVVRSLANVPKD